MKTSIRRHHLFLCLLTAFANLLLFKAPTNAQPNVVIVLTDDQGYGDLSAHGHPTLETPNLDQLYSESVRLTDFHVAPVCTPTRSQLLTGQDAMHNGAWSWAYGHEMMRHDVKTMAEIFKENGYRTGLFGKWHLGHNYPHRPEDRGFVEFVTFAGAAVHQTPDHWQNDNFSDFYRHPDGTWRQHDGFATNVWFDRAMEFMEESQSRDRPFFTYVATNAPHWPYYVPDEHANQYDNVSGAARKYFGMVDNIDENMGRLEAFLERTGLAENTILIFMTDNGPVLLRNSEGVPLYNAGMRGRKQQLYEGGHRVPFFIQWPGGALRDPGAIDELTQVQDVLPTLIDFCGLDIDPDTAASFDGASLAPLLRGEKDELQDRMLVVQWSRRDYPKYGNAAVMWKKWRLVHNQELYNLENDPMQKNDVSNQHPDIVQKMQDYYAKWWESVKPVVSSYPRIVIGHNTDTMKLTCFDWSNRSGRGNVAQQSSVWRGSNLNGEWKIEVQEAGMYRVEARRYPRETGTAMRAKIPATEREYRNFPATRAMPISKVRLCVADIDQTTKVKENDKAAVFDVQLPEGKTSMKTWFLNDQGTTLSGAYYVYLKRKTQRTE